MIEERGESNVVAWEVASRLPAGKEIATPAVMKILMIMNTPTFEHLEEVAEDEIAQVSAAEWDIDPRMMGNVVAGVIAGRLQNEGLRLYGDAEELGVECTVRAAVLLALQRRAHLSLIEAGPCIDGVIRYLSEPPFNQPDPPYESRNAA